jgi:hypothetical protein
MQEKITSLTLTVTVRNKETVTKPWAVFCTLVCLDAFLLQNKFNQGKHFFLKVDKRQTRR